MTNTDNLLQIIAQPEQQTPLTETALCLLLLDIDPTTKRLPPGFKAFARAIEAAHGIAQPKDKPADKTGYVITVNGVAQPEQGHDLHHVIETLIDHGNGKYKGPVSKAQRDKAIAICGALEHPANERNFCPRCGKRLGGVDDVHTCTAPAHLNLSKKTVEKLHTFLDASAGDGVISDGVDAADLYIEIFPEQYAEGTK